MTRARMPEIDEYARQVAQEHGNRYLHYRMLHDRASLLIADAIVSLGDLNIAPKDKDRITRHNIYQLENINQLLCVVLGTMQTRRDITETIAKNIKENRVANKLLQKELDDEQG